ncbi:uncharacterized protein LOC144308782 isoform X2 [Canis aureus]
MYFFVTFSSVIFPNILICSDIHLLLSKFIVFITTRKRVSNGRRTGKRRMANFTLLSGCSLDLNIGISRDASENFKTFNNVLNTWGIKTKTKSNNVGGRGSGKEQRIGAKGKTKVTGQKDSSNLHGKVAVDRLPLCSTLEILQSILTEFSK